VHPFNLLDWDGNGCSELADLWQANQLWRTTYLGDPNGDGFLDIRDYLYLYINTDGCPRRIAPDFAGPGLSRAFSACGFRRPFTQGGGDSCLIFATLGWFVQGRWPCRHKGSIDGPWFFPKRQPSPVFSGRKWVDL
jgi:hypothetical protein